MPRGKDGREDDLLKTRLLSDEKELAEHNMLVDLGRNDIGKISKFNSVTVEYMHKVEFFSHVMHITTTVKGKIKDDCDALDAIVATCQQGLIWCTKNTSYGNHS